MVPIRRENILLNPMKISPGTWLAPHCPLNTSYSPAECPRSRTDFLTEKFSFHAFRNGGSLRSYNGWYRKIQLSFACTIAMVKASMVQILVPSSACIRLCALNVKIFGKLRFAILFLQPMFHYSGRSSQKWSWFQWPNCYNKPLTGTMLWNEKGKIRENIFICNGTDLSFKYEKVRFEDVSASVHSQGRKSFDLNRHPNPMKLTETNSA